MGMGYAGCFAVVIEENDLGKVVPTQFKQFDAARKAFEATDEAPGFSEFAIAKENEDKVMDCDENLPELVALDTAYKNLTEAFKKKTGIQVRLGYHNHDDYGDRYDDLEGAFWGLEFTDCYPASEEFNALRKKCKGWVGIRHFVTFG